MKDFQSNFSTTVDSFLSKRFKPFEKRIIVGRNHVAIDPNFLIEHSCSFNLKEKGLKDLIALAILSWYLGDIGWLLRADLAERNKQLCLTDQVILDILIESKAQMLIFLAETSLWHTRDFFGNIIPILQQHYNNLPVRFPTRRKPKKPIRKRGYNDKGSHRTDSTFLSARPYWKETEQQNRLEAERLSYKDTLSLIQGFLI